MREDDAGAAPGRARAPERRGDPPPGTAARGRRTRTATRASAADPDGVPGPVCLPRPEVAGPGHRDRAVGRSALRVGAAGAGGPAPAAGGALRGGPRQVPASVLGWATAASGDRPCAVRRAGAGGVRRADVGTRRVGAGAG